MTLGEIFNSKIKGMEKIKRELPILVANEAKNFFQESFRNQGFTDENLKPWDKRKRDRDPGRGILIGKGSGKLFRSIRVASKTFEKIVIASNMPYSAVHNYGLQSGRRGREFTMPKRQFMGPSKVLDKKIHELVTKYINNFLAK